MAVSVFDLFKIGIGPSSSHTVGPMRAAARFVQRWLAEPGDLARVARVRAEVFGSLALTGRGHGTDKAVLMGLEGHWPNEIDPDLIPAALEAVRKGGVVVAGGIHMSDIPSFPYRILWGERVVRSVANLTRRDALEFLALAPEVPVRTATELFPLTEANAALDRLRARIEPVDLVVADVEMPRLTGFGLVEALRAEEDFARLPIVLMTSRGDEEDIARGLQLGADAYLTKQKFDQRELLDTIGQLL